MFRALACVLCCAAAPVFAQSQANDCAVFGQIAETAAQERQGGAEMMDTMVKIAEGFTGSQERFAGAVPLLVDWVYKLPEAQLSQGVGAAYESECVKQ